MLVYLPYRVRQSRTDLSVNPQQSFKWSPLFSHPCAMLEVIKIMLINVRITKTFGPVSLVESRSFWVVYHKRVGFLNGRFLPVPISGANEPLKLAFGNGSEQSRHYPTNKQSRNFSEITLTVAASIYLWCKMFARQSLAHSVGSLGVSARRRPDGSCPEFRGRSSGRYAGQTKPSPGWAGGRHPDLLPTHS